MGDEVDHEERSVLTSVELPDGSVCGGLFFRTGDELVLQLYGEMEVPAGEEVRVQGDQYFRIRDVRRGVMDDFPVTDLVVEGPFHRLLRGHSLGDGWPQLYWRDLAAQCEDHGFARPIVRFLELLGELRTAEQVGMARSEMRSLSAGHLATVTGQVGGALLNLERLGAPADLVEDISALYRMLVDEMERRQGEYGVRPDPARHVRYGSRQPESWRRLDDWVDLVS